MPKRFGPFGIKAGKAEGEFFANPPFSIGLRQCFGTPGGKACGTRFSQWIDRRRGEGKLGHWHVCIGGVKAGVARKPGRSTAKQRRKISHLNPSPNRGGI